MRSTNRNFAYSTTLVSALAELGLRHVCLCPGSRSGPLAMAFAAEDRIDDWTHHDERSAAFFALGAAKSIGAPAAVVTTSGTAAAELFPAAVEARNARVPLLLITADRPAELRDVGAPQAIDQIKLYGDAVKWFHDAGAPEPTAEFIRTVPSVAARAWAEAVSVPAGPVHLNVPLREPLVPEAVPRDVPDPFPDLKVPRYVTGRPALDDTVISDIGDAVAGKRALLVAGPESDVEFATAAATFGAAQSIPIAADALSGLRCGPHDQRAVIAHSEALVSAGWLEDNPPEVVIRTGALPTAKPLFRWLERRPDITQILIEPAGWRDPLTSVAAVVRAEPAATLAALTKAISSPAPADWLGLWRQADDGAAAALGDAVASFGFPTEPAVAAALGEGLPADSTLWTASSMPVRDVDAFLARRPEGLRILANRGANGIDGFVSSGLGSAVATGQPTYLLSGDLSLLHDLTALATAAKIEVPAVVVAVHNDGGGIFEFLPQAGYPDFERLFVTPHGLDFTVVAGALGVDAVEVGRRAELLAALEPPNHGPRLVQIRTERSRNVEVHRAAQAAVGEVVAALS